ncbi:MAG: cation diffusion facilitator family transporter, partial [Longimicrobiales bacterium]
MLGFGIDSFVESASGSVLIWRLLAEGRISDHEAVEALERRALKLVALSLFLLAAFVIIKAVLTLVQQERPDPSPVGIAVTSLSIGVMWWLARAKRSTAIALGSRSLEADAFQTTACWWLSIIVLGGIGLNALFGWWWADPVAAIGMTYFLRARGAARPGKATTAARYDRPTRSELLHAPLDRRRTADRQRSCASHVPGWLRRSAAGSRHLLEAGSRHSRQVASSAPRERVRSS